MPVIRLATIDGAELLAAQEHADAAQDLAALRKSKLYTQVVVDGVRVHGRLCWDSTDSYAARVWLPRGMRRDFVQAMHVHGVGHRATEETLRNCRAVVYFPNMRRLCAKVCRSCVACGRSKVRPGLAVQPRTTSQGDFPGDVVVIDFVGPITPPSKFGSFTAKYVFSITEVMLSWTTFEPTEGSTAKTAALVLFHYGFCDLFRPLIVRSDRGSEFIAEVFTELLEYFKIKHVMGSSYTPTSQSITEVTHKFLNETLRLWCLSNPKDTWSLAVKPAQWLLRTSTHVRKGYSPYELLVGLRPRNLIGELAPNTTTFWGRFWDGRFSRLIEIRDEVVAKHRELQREYTEAIEDSATAPTVGSLFMVKRLAATKLEEGHPSRRLQPVATGPVKIIECYGQSSLVEDVESGQCYKVNHRRLMSLQAEADA